MTWHFDDGGRATAGLKPHCQYTEPPGDCVVRAISIAAEIEYSDTNRLFREVFKQATAKLREDDAGSSTYCRKYRCGPQMGVPSNLYIPILERLGFRRVRLPISRLSHLCEADPCVGLPLYPGRFVVRTKRHLCAVVDGVLRDLNDIRGQRCFSLYKLTETPDADYADYFKIPRRGNG